MTVVDRTDPLAWRSVRWLALPGGTCLHGWLLFATEGSKMRSGCGLYREISSLCVRLDKPPRCRVCTGEGPRALQTSALRAYSPPVTPIR